MSVVYIHSYTYRCVSNVEFFSSSFNLSGFHLSSVLARENKVLERFFFFFVELELELVAEDICSLKSGGRKDV